MKTAKTPKTTEKLHTCPKCQRANFTAAGLKVHRCGEKVPKKIIVKPDGSWTPSVPAIATESLLGKIARERREARAATGAAPPPVMPRTKLKRRKSREVIVEVEKKPLMLKVGELDFHPHLKRVGLLPSLINRETVMGNKAGKSRGEHKANAEELSAEFEALKLSILENGILEPIKVTQMKKGQWLVVDGRHRYLAVQDIVESNGPLDTKLILNPAHLANADKLTREGIPCVEIQPNEVDAVILAAVKRRHFSKGALAYLAVLMNPSIATEAKRGGDQKSNRRNCALIEDYTIGSRIAGFAKQAGVSERMMEYAIRLFKTFKDREDARILFEPGIWVGDSLDRLIGGVEHWLKYGFDPEETKETEEQRTQRIANERAGIAVDRFDKLSVSLRVWEDLQPEGQLRVIERAVLVLSEAPMELRQAIHKGLSMIPGAV